MKTTLQDRKDIVELCKLGWPYGWIADAYEVAYSYVSKLAYEHGLESRKPRVTDEELECASEYKTPTTLAAKLGVSYERAEHILRKVRKVRLTNNGTHG